MIIFAGCPRKRSALQTWYKRFGRFIQILYYTKSILFQLARYCHCQFKLQRKCTITSFFQSSCSLIVSSLKSESFCKFKYRIKTFSAAIFVRLIKSTGEYLFCVIAAQLHASCLREPGGAARRQGQGGRCKMPSKVQTVSDMHRHRQTDGGE